MVGWFVFAFCLFFFCCCCCLLCFLRGGQGGHFGFFLLKCLCVCVCAHACACVCFGGGSHSTNWIYLSLFLNNLSLSVQIRSSISHSPLWRSLKKFQKQCIITLYSVKHEHTCYIFEEIRAEVPVDTLYTGCSVAEDCVVRKRQHSCGVSTWSVHCSLERWDCNHRETNVRYCHCVTAVC